MSKLIPGLVLLLSLIACTKNAEEPGGLPSIYRQYKNGEIDECRLNGHLVYCAGQNAYDAGSVVFDSTGKVLGSCNYAWGKVDSICKQLKSCEVIYRCKDAITGLPFYDKYGLSK